MDVLLLNARVKNPNYHAAMTPPLGLAYIGAVLLEDGFSVEAKDLNATELGDEDLIRLLLEGKPRLVGISAYTETYNNALHLAAIIKKTDSKIPIVIGGPHVSVLPDETLSAGVFDVVSIGEGEYTILELARLYVRGDGDLDDIKGIAFMRNSEIIRTAERESVSDVDTLPFPARELFHLEAYRLPAALLTSRGGCPFACNFCAVNNIWKGSRRFRSPEKVIEEIDFLVKNFSFDILNFSDDSFTLSRSRIMRLCELIRERYGIMVLNWQCATRVDLIDEELIRSMRSAGCQIIQFGVESGSQRVLDTTGKRITLKQVDDAVKLVLKYGITPLCSFMFPHPADTEESLQEQIELMKSLKHQGAQLSLALTTPYPGTYYNEMHEPLGLKILSDNWDEYDCQHIVIETDRFSEAELQLQLERMVREVGLV